MLLKKLEDYYILKFPKKKEMNLLFGLLTLKAVQVIIFIKLGSVKKGREGKADCTFSMIDDDLISMADGKLNP